MTDDGLGEEALLAAAVRLASGVEALAALAAYLRIETEEIDADPEVRARLRDVVVELLGTDALPPGPARGQVVGMAGAFLRQAVDLVDDPGRRGGWEHVDAALLQGLGRLSGAVAGAMRVAAVELDGLGERLGAGGRFLDVGTGTGWLAIAVARAFPAAAVVGIDLFGTPLALARANVAAEGLDDRIELRLLDVGSLDETEAYDAVWLPLPFLSRADAIAALAAARRALRPGGWVLPGLFVGAGDALTRRLVELRTVRGGGVPWADDDLLAAVRAAGFADVCEVGRTWAAPVRLFAGRA